MKKINLGKMICVLCVMCMLCGLVACGKEEAANNTQQEQNSVDAKVSTVSTEPATNDVVTDTPGESAVDESNTPAPEEDIQVDAPTEPQFEGPFTIDSCFGTYKCDNGDSFTFEGDSASDNYSFTDFVLNGEAVEEHMYPYFKDSSFTEKEDGIEVMTMVGSGTNPDDIYIILFKKDGTADFSWIKATMGPVGDTITLKKQ